MSEQRGGGAVGACATPLASFIWFAGAMSTEERVDGRHTAGDQHREREDGGSPACWRLGMGND